MIWFAIDEQRHIGQLDIHIVRATHFDLHGIILYNFKYQFLIFLVQQIERAGVGIGKGSGLDDNLFQKFLGVFFRRQGKPDLGKGSIPAFVSDERLFRKLQPPGLIRYSTEEVISRATTPMIL